MDEVTLRSAALSCVTTAEDKELDLEALCDIRHEHLASSESKTAKALKHLDIFLVGYCKKINAPLVNSRQLTYYGIKTSGTVEEANVWWGDMIGHFFNYLHKDAYKYGDPEKGRVMYETATGYASSVKVYYGDKFRNCGPELTCLARQSGENCATNYSRNPKRKQREPERHSSMAMKPQRTRIAMQLLLVAIGWAPWKLRSSSTSTTQ